MPRQRCYRRKQRIKFKSASFQNQNEGIGDNEIQGPLFVKNHDVSDLTTERNQILRLCRGCAETLF